MKLRNKILTGAAAVLLLAVVVFAGMLSYDQPCTPPIAAAVAAATMRAVSYTRSGQRWDVIIDNVGNHPVLANRRALTEDGVYVMVGGPAGKWFGPLLRPLWAMLVNPFVGQELVMLMARQSRADLETLAGMLASGQLRTIIDRHFALQDIADAIRYSESGRARGKIIIDVAD